MNEFNAKKHLPPGIRDDVLHALSNFYSCKLNARITPKGIK